MSQASNRFMPSVESLETRETPAGRIFIIYPTGPGPERLGSDTSVSAQVRLTAPEPRTTPAVTNEHEEFIEIANA